MRFITIKTRILTLNFNMSSVRKLAIKTRILREIDGYTGIMS